MNKLSIDMSGAVDFSDWGQPQLLLYLKNSLAYDNQPLTRQNRLRAIKQLITPPTKKG